MMKSLSVQNYQLFPKQHVVTLVALVLRVCLRIYLIQRMHWTVLYRKYIGEYDIFKEIQCCIVKTTTNVLEILNLDGKNSHILKNYLVFPKQHIVTLYAFVLLVCLSLYLPQRMHCTIFSWKNMCEYHILRKYTVAE